jgi:NAD(P)-dependent dehydrogenase (short-subunit alcohol dehydrogenase family)
VSEPIRFDGRVAIVTGAGRGLGREFALLLAQRGACVVVNDIGVSADDDRYGGTGDAAAAQRVVDEIRADGGAAVANTGDVADPAGAGSIVTDALDAFGRLDIVINNAGIVVDGSLTDTDPDRLVRAWSVHVGGSYNVLRASWRHLSEQRYGRVVNVASVAGLLVGVPGHTPYDVAKGALCGMTRALATEGQQSGIVVNALIPTADTRGARSVVRSYQRGRMYEARHVAPAAAWLSHEDCAVTGRFFAAGAGRVGEVFTSAAAGYQCPEPASFALEHIRDHWGEVRSRDGAITPSSLAEYNAFRVARYEAAVT